MAHVGAWQFSEQSPFDSEEIAQNDGELGSLQYAPAVSSVGTTTSYPDGYVYPSTYPRVAHTNNPVGPYNAYGGVPPAMPVTQYWSYGDGMAGQTAVQETQHPASHLDGNGIFGRRTTAETVLSYPFASTAPALVSYIHDHAQPFALYQPRISSAPVALPAERRLSYFPQNHPALLRVQSSHSGLQSSTPNPPHTASEESWEQISRPGSTIYSSSSGRVLSYEAEAINSGSTSEDADDIRISNPRASSRTPSSRMKSPMDKDGQEGQQKPGKMRPHTAERAPKSRVSKRSGKLNPQQRSKAAEMRKAGRCFRCALYKLGCDLGEPCGNCSKVLNSARSFLEPCFRSDLKSIKLIRQCNGRFGQEIAGFRNYRWAGPDNHSTRMIVDWILPANVPIGVSSMNVPIRRYIPDNDTFDSTDFHYNVNGHLGRVALPPFAVSDTAELLNIIDEFLFNAQSEVEHWIHNRFRNDPIKSATFAEACRYREQYGSSLIAKAIQMQCGAIMSQGCGVVRDGPEIGLKYVDFRQLGHSNYEAYNRGSDRPLPQAMGHQFDVAILLKINEWQKDFLKDLKTKIFMSGPKPWYEIFLACFVLLSNLEYIYGGALAYIQVKHGTDLQNQVAFVVRQQTTKWDAAARVLLQHYRCVARGHLPFLNPRLDPEELRDGGFDEETIIYLLKIAKLLEMESRSPYSTMSPTTDVSPPYIWSRLLFSEGPVP